MVNLYIPRDKVTAQPKGFAFTEYESEEIANYAASLFSGFVTLYNRTLKFGISGKDKPSSAAITPTSNSPLEPIPHPMPGNNMESSQHSMGLRTPS